MFVMSIGSVKRSTRLKVLAIFSALALAVLTAVGVTLATSQSKKPYTDFETDIKDCGSVSEFLRNLRLEPLREESKRDITLPDSSDEVFSEYCGFLEKAGFRLMEFSRKRVEERYLKLKNKTADGKHFYAVLYTYKEQVIGAHLTTLSQNEPLMQICEFV